MQTYKAKQTNLCRLGVADVAIVAIGTHRSGVEGNLADEGLELLQELLNAGNAHVQVSQRSRAGKCTTHHTMPRHTAHTPCHATQRHATPRHTTSHHAIDEGNTHV